MTLTGPVIVLGQVHFRDELPADLRHVSADELLLLNDQIASLGERPFCI